MTRPTRTSNYAWAEMPAGPAGKATLGFTVAYSMGVDSQNKDAELGADQLPHRARGHEDLDRRRRGEPVAQRRPGAPGKEILVKGAEYAQPWSFIPGFTEINDAFNNAMTGRHRGHRLGAGHRDGDQGSHRQQPAVADA